MERGCEEDLLSLALIPLAAVEAESHYDVIICRSGGADLHIFLHQVDHPVLDDAGHLLQGLFTIQVDCNLFHDNV